MCGARSSGPSQLPCVRETGHYGGHAWDCGYCPDGRHDDGPVDW